MKTLKNISDVKSFLIDIASCKGDVYIISHDRKESFNLKSPISAYVALDKLAAERGDEYEIFCQLPADEDNLLKYFFER